jgi:hypothetical protein
MTPPKKMHWLRFWHQSDKSFAAPAANAELAGRPKLTFRDLFAVVTIVALALGWWVDRSRLARDAELLRVKLSVELSRHAHLRDWDEMRDQPSPSN